MTVQTDTSTTLKEAAANSLDKTTVAHDNANGGGNSEQQQAALVGGATEQAIVIAHNPDDAAADNAAATTKSELYAQFRRDPEKMQQMEEFVNGLLDSAGKEAEVRQAVKEVRQRCLRIIIIITYVYVRPMN